MLAAVALATAAVGAGSPAARPGPTPPPTPVPPAGSPSPFPTALATPPPSAAPPEVSAAAVALVDLDSGRTLLERAATSRRSVASTTKVMTALLVLERTSPGETVVVSERAARERGAELGLEVGERIPVRDLLYALMLQSSNDAAVALAEHVSGDVESFVAAMNRRARELGATDTRFRSPNGLDDRGFSTARDMALITVEAYRHPLFARVVRTRFRTIPAPEGPPRRVQNRNVLLWLYEGAIGVKTGFTSAAGFCLVAAAEREGLRLAAVVLGAPEDAFSDAAALLSYGFEAFERRAVVEEGEAFDPVLVGGVEVPVVAGGDLLALMPADGQIVVSERVDPGLSPPIPAGSRVGRLVVSSAGEPLGEVPLLAAGSVGEEEAVAGPPPWWEGALDGVGDSMTELVRSLF